MFLYVVRHGAVLGISGGLLTIKYPDKTEDAFPMNTIEGISVLFYSDTYYRMINI